MACGVCGQIGHNQITCDHAVARAAFSRSIGRSKRCECCGQYGYDIQRHHTRGRGNLSDFLDLCADCHIECGHGGHFQNLPIKPRVCQVLGGASWWCS